MAKQRNTPTVEDVQAVDFEVPAVPPEGSGGGAGDEGAKPPPYGKQEPATAGALPRVVGERVRVLGPGGKRYVEGNRYKVACRYHEYHPPLYILARDEAEAEAHYLQTTGLAAKIEKLKKLAGSRADAVDMPTLTTTTLPD